MRVDQAFKKAGFEIVGATKGDKSIVFDVRVPLQERVPARWKNLLADILPLAEHIAGTPNPKWELEVSKRFYSRAGTVRYLWRVVMKGDLAACQTALVRATLNSLRVGNELSEVPLVGQVTYTPDPKNGKFKGAYPRDDDDLASRAVAAAFSVGGG